MCVDGGVFGSVCVCVCADNGDPARRERKHEEEADGIPAPSIEPQ